MEQEHQVTLGEILRTFLFIGTTSFGGGMAAVAFVERVCVHEKKWLNHEEFMHGIAFGQILGPFSLNSCTFVGYSLRGPLGGMLAAIGFIAPSFALISFFSWLYFRYHELPQLQSALKGTNPVVIALIIVAAVGMARTKVRSPNTWFVALAAFVAAALFKVSGLTILIVAGLWSLAKSWYAREHR
jgi:chromate transporter